MLYSWDVYIERLLVVTDHCNSSVKATDGHESISTTTKIVCLCQLPSQPRGVSAISDSRFIAALPNTEQIQILNIRYVND